MAGYETDVQHTAAGIHREIGDTCSNLAKSGSRSRRETTAFSEDVSLALTIFLVCTYQRRCPRYV